MGRCGTSIEAQRSICIGARPRIGAFTKIMDGPATFFVTFGQAAASTGDAQQPESGPPAVTCLDVVNCMEADKCGFGDASCADACPATTGRQFLVDGVVSCVNSNCSTQCMNSGLTCNTCRQHAIEPSGTLAGRLTTARHEPAMKQAVVATRSPCARAGSVVARRMPNARAMGEVSSA